MVDNRYGVIRALTHAVDAAYPDSLSADAVAARSALKLIHDVIGILPAGHDMAMFGATIYGAIQSGGGNTMQSVRMKEFFTRIDSAIGALREFYVTADLDRLLQSESVMREAYDGEDLDANAYITITRGDAIGAQYIATEIAGSFPSGRVFVAELAFDTEAHVWQFDASAKRSAMESEPICMDSFELGARLPANTVMIVRDSLRKMMRVTSAANITYITQQLRSIA